MNIYRLNLTPVIRNFGNVLYGVLYNSEDSKERFPCVAYTCYEDIPTTKMKTNAMHIYGVSGFQMTREVQPDGTLYYGSFKYFVVPNEIDVGKEWVFKESGYLDALRSKIESDYELFLDDRSIEFGKNE